MLVTFRLSTLGFGGTERVFISVADYLATRYGYSIDFVVDRLFGHETENVVLDKGYRVIELGAIRTAKSIKSFAGYLTKEAPAIVISAYTETNGAALISNALIGFRTPMIITEHASLDEHWSGKSFARRVFLEFIVRYLYRLGDRVSCVSSGMADQIRRRLKHRHIGYIHNPVRFAMRTHTKSEARRMLGISNDAKVVLAVGRVSRQKNYLMLLKALVDADLDVSAKLYIVGGVFEQSEKLKLDEFISQNKLSERVVFVGFTHDVHAYYEAADMLVLSSAWEGFGNVLVEALAFGLPIISTYCNYGPAEILADGKYGLLVDVDDYRGMGGAIKSVLTQNPFDPELQILRAREFSEERIGEAYYQMICEISKQVNA